MFSRRTYIIPIIVALSVLLGGFVFVSYVTAQTSDVLEATLDVQLNVITSPTLAPEPIPEQTKIRCETDIEAANKESAGKICTQQIAAMSCPDDSSVTYNATDGCLISELEKRGWTQAPEPIPTPPTQLYQCPDSDYAENVPFLEYGCFSNCLGQIQNSPTCEAAGNIPGTRICDVRETVQCKPVAPPLSEAVCIKPVLADRSLEGQVEQAFSYALTGTTIIKEGTLPISFSAQGLPQGLLMLSDTVTGIRRIAGVPQEAGSFTVTIIAQNACGSYSGEITLNIAKGDAQIRAERLQVLKTVVAQKIGALRGEKKVQIQSALDAGDFERTEVIIAESRALLEELKREIQGFE